MKEVPRKLSDCLCNHLRLRYSSLDLCIGRNRRGGSDCVEALLTGHATEVGPKRDLTLRKESGRGVSNREGSDWVSWRRGGRRHSDKPLDTTGLTRYAAEIDPVRHLPLDESSWHGHCGRDGGDWCGQKQIGLR
jgi:hypothetical protein